MQVEFKAWPKMTRLNPYQVVITEKIDGTNACIVIEDGKIVGVQSRKRFISVGADNYGFARWVSENEEDLLNLGDGYHYGEWAGLGIQKNPLGLDSKRFFLFNAGRWNAESKPDCCSVVPVLHTGEFSAEIVEDLLQGMRDSKGEGVCVYYPAFDKYTKHTVKSHNGKWCK